MDEKTEPQSETLKNEYRFRFASSTDYRQKVWRVLCKFFSRFIRADLAVFDLGCGYGEFINNVVAEKKFAMDLNPDSREKLDPAVVFMRQDCSVRWPLRDQSLGTVFTSNFLEHLPSKTHIESTITEVRRCLESDGVLVCLGPNIRFVPGDYWNFWDHHVAISDKSLCELLTMNGFSIELCVPRFLPYTMSDGLSPPIFLVWLYLRLPIVWRFLGKQFLVIARKT